MYEHDIKYECRPMPAQIKVTAYSHVVVPGVACGTVVLTLYHEQNLHCPGLRSKLVTKL